MFFCPSLMTHVRSANVVNIFVLFFFQIVIKFLIYVHDIDIYIKKREI